MRELLETGRFEYFETLRAEFPPTIFELFTISGLGPKKIKALYDQLDVSDLAKLEAVALSGRVAGLPGFGKKTAENILKPSRTDGKTRASSGSATWPQKRAL